MKLKRIEHVQLAMPKGKEDIARSFYSGVLGLQEVSKPPNLVMRGGCWFECLEVKVHLGVEADFSPALKAHPAFVVEDLDECRAVLAESNIQCSDDEPLLGFLRTYISDPFGNRIELMQVIEENE